MTLDTRMLDLFTDTVLKYNPKGEPAKPIGKAKKTENNVSTYAPMSSVWEGSDGALLEAIFKFYPTIPVEPILDSTYNAGRFWKGSKRDVVSMDIDPQYKPMIVGDNRKMEGVPSAKYGVVVYDPPHVGPVNGPEYVSRRGGTRTAAAGVKKRQTQVAQARSAAAKPQAKPQVAARASNGKPSGRLAAAR